MKHLWAMALMSAVAMLALCMSHVPACRADLPAVLDVSNPDSQTTVNGKPLKRVRVDGRDWLFWNPVAPSAEFTVTYRAGVWDLSGVDGLKVAVRNVSSAPAIVRMTAYDSDSRGLAGTCRSVTEVKAGETSELTLRLIRRPQDPTFEPFRPFYMYVKAINVRDNTVDPSHIVKVIVSANGADLAHGLDIGSILPGGKGVPSPVPFFPFIDQYGQYIHSDWPGKVYSDADFSILRDREERETSTSPRPQSWDKYGGWSDGPVLKATGFFHPAKEGGKWWLVDPDGKLFWSYGPTGVGFGGDVSPVTDRQNWFASLPPTDGPLGQFYHDGWGAMFRYYQYRWWRGFDIQQANLYRKYGPDYRDAVAQVSHQRLHSWGFNTIGNWSAPQVYLLHETPYTVPINSPSVSVMKGTDGHSFQDVYDPAWEPGLYAEMKKQRGKTAGDPWCIGYFVDNERAIGWRPRGASIGEMALEAPPTQPAKAQFIKLLQSKYKTIAALDAAWNTQYASWDALLAVHPQNKAADALLKTKAVLSDCGDFGMVFCERYFSVCRTAVKHVAPNNLFLGTRFYGHTDAEVVKMASRYMDVISYNIYDNPPDGRVNEYAKLDAPLMITEWGIGSDPIQTPFRDEKLTTELPSERAALMTRYVEHALRLPNLVGAHFFQFRDQPLSGRPDGEATLRGFVNVADTPNFELVSANRALGYHLYEIRANAK